MKKAIKMWLQTGIIPVFANGNAGPLCESVRFPAESTEAITVGATDYDNRLAPFSGRGPGVNGAIKPDISAPGVDIVSTSSTSDDAYDLYTGTSAAAPHVTGSIALLLSVAPSLNLTKIKEYLFQGVSTSNLKQLDHSCGVGNANETVNGFPNNDYGYGLVNIFHSIELLYNASSKTNTPSNFTNSSSKLTLEEQ
jgi:subtilisin family serine protease